MAGGNNFLQGHGVGFLDIVAAALKEGVGGEYRPFSEDISVAGDVQRPVKREGKFSERRADFGWIDAYGHRWGHFHDLQNAVSLPVAEVAAESVYERYGEHYE